MGSMRTGFGGVLGRSPRDFFATTPLSLPENEGNAFFITNYSKKLPTIVLNQGHRFMLVMPCSHKFVLEGTSDSKAEKTKCERKLNDPTTPTTDSLGKNQFR